MYRLTLFFRLQCITYDSLIDDTVRLAIGFGLLCIALGCMAYPMLLSCFYSVVQKNYPLLILLQRAQCSHYKRCILATAIPSVRLSVRPSVRHTPVLCQNDGT